MAVRYWRTQGFDVMIEDHLSRYGIDARRGMKRAMKLATTNAVTQAKQIATDLGAVDTGRYRASIHAVYDFSNEDEYRADMEDAVDYGVWIELGTRYMAERPVFVNAWVWTAEPDLQRYLQQELNLPDYAFTARP